ncbi:MAG: hypothetical protein ACRDC6_32085, partial [Shewanella sp.]
NRIVQVKVWPLREMQSHTRTPISSTLFRDEAATQLSASPLLKPPLSPRYQAHSLYVRYGIKKNLFTSRM